MMKEQKETIERLNRFKSIKVLYGNTFAMTTEQLKILQEDIETAINILKEKDKKIEKDRELKHRLCKEVNQMFTEVEEKDKIIDLMATFIDAQNTRMLEDEYTSIKNIYTIIGFDKDKEGIKQYFERKVKE